MERSYEITCTKCQGKSLVGISETLAGDIVNYRKIGTVISARKRLDGQWGWQCYCGNNSIVTKQERKMIKNLQQPEPQEIADVVKNLKIEPVKETVAGTLVSGFLMRAVG